MTAVLPDIFVQDIERALPARAIIKDASAIAPHLVEWRERWKGQCALLLQPATSDEVAMTVELCARHGVAIVPQGGNTGLVGGAIPTQEGPTVLLSLKRMNAIRAMDPVGFTMVAEAGVVLATAQETAAQKDRLFPLSLASEGSATIGGLAATNAGGVHVLRYGSMRDLVLGVEVVLANGTIHHGLTPLRKDNSGYDLRHLMVGSEGTLGIITAVSLKLFAATTCRSVALAGLTDPAQALALLSLARKHAGDQLNAFEFLPRLGLEMTCRHIAGCTEPFDRPYPWYVLIELAGCNDIQATALAKLMETALSSHVICDAVIAQSEQQARSLWRLRDAMSEAQKHEGGSIKHDIAVPVGQVPAFLEVATAKVEAMMPGIRPVPFGHLGDGNIHFNLSQPKDMDKANFLGHWEEIERVVHDIVIDFGGSIAAEHGIGQLKVAELERTADRAKITTMRAIKQALDPQNIMNPGRVLAIHD